MRLRLHDLNVILALDVQGVPLRCNAIAVQLTALFLGIPIYLVNFQDRAWNKFAVVGVKRFESVNNALDFIPRQCGNGRCSIRHCNSLSMFLGYYGRTVRVTEKVRSA